MMSYENNNEKFLGNWNNDNPNSEGFLFKDGIKRKSEWKNGEFIRWVEWDNCNISTDNN